MRISVAVVLISLAASACSRPVPPSVPILLFTGTGASPGDVAAFESILDESKLEYATVSSAQLDALTPAQLQAHRLLLIPGGNFVDLGKNLSASTSANVRTAVQGGLNYLGVCAGAFFAGNSPFNGLNLTSGVQFKFYSAEERGIRKAAVAISTAQSTTTLEQYWEDGPQLSGWGAVVAKYPDGTPAVVEGSAGGGWVILSGVHPEAPESWRRGMNFQTPVNADRDYARALILAALNRASLPHY